MERLLYSIPAALLRGFTTLAAQTDSITRWSSIYHMVLKYSEIREHVSKVEHADVKERLLCDDENQKVEELLRVLASLRSVTMKLKSKRMDILDAWNLFDGSIKEFQSFTIGLSQSANIVDSVPSPKFVKYRTVIEDSLSCSELRVVPHLLKNQSGDA